MENRNLPEPLLSVIYCSRRLRSCGRYTDARRHFDELQYTSAAHTPKPVLCEIIWSHLNEGNYQAAATTLPRLQPEDDKDQPSHDCDALLRLQKAYVDMRREGSVEDCLRLLDKMQWEDVPESLYGRILVVDTHLLRFEILLYANRFGFRQHGDDQHTLGRLYEEMEMLSAQLPPPWRDTTYALWVIHHITRCLPQEDKEQAIMAVANEVDHSHGLLDAEFMRFKRQSMKQFFNENAIIALNFLENKAPVGDDFITLPLADDEAEIFNVHASLNPVLGPLSANDLDSLRRLQSSYENVGYLTGKIRVLEYLLQREYDEADTLKELRITLESIGDIYAMHYVVGLAELGTLVKNNQYPSGRLRLEQLLEDGQVPFARLKTLYSGYINSIYAHLGILSSLAEASTQTSGHGLSKPSSATPVLHGRSGKNFLDELSKGASDLDDPEYTKNWPSPVQQYLADVRLGSRVEEIVGKIKQHENNPARVDGLLTELKEVMSLRSPEAWKDGSRGPLQSVSMFYNIARVQIYLTAFDSIDIETSLVEARKYLENALSMGTNPYWEFHCHLLLANTWTPIESEQTTDSRKKALEHFWKAEELSTRFRLQTPFLPARFGGKLETLEMKQTFAKSIDEGATLQRVLYSTILGAGGSFSETESRYLEIQAWNLIQVSKSRALLDVASEDGGGATVQEPPIGQESLNLASQPPFTLGDLKLISNRAEREIIFVDWICLMDQIFLVAVGETGRPAIFQLLQITPQEVKDWKKKHLDSASMEDPIAANSSLEELRGLIGPVTLLVRGGEMLIFCPSGPLHDIPLHAIPMGDGNPIIHNYPVVYTTSLTLLSRCLQRSCVSEQNLKTPSQSSEYRQQQGQNVVVSVYERGSMEEMKILETFTPELGRLLDATIFSGSNADLSTIVAHANQSRIFHFYGHAHFGSEKPRLNALELSDGKLWTVQEMFVGLDLTDHHPLITIMGCDSGRERYAIGDEPLGVKTAFFQAGASTFVGTLWPIGAADGRKFSAEFYKNVNSETNRQSCIGVESRIREQMQYLAVRGINRDFDDGNLGRDFDLAEATRAAIVRIKDDMRTRAPYHWASFTLSGSWLFRKRPATAVMNLEGAGETKDSYDDSEDRFILKEMRTKLETFREYPRRDRYRAVWKSHDKELSARLNSVRDQVLLIMRRLLDVLSLLSADSVRSNIEDLQDTTASFRNKAEIPSSSEISKLVMALYMGLEKHFKVYVDDVLSKRGEFGSEEEYQLALHTSMDDMMDKLDIFHQERLLYYECVSRNFEEMCTQNTPDFRIYRTRMDSW